MTAGKAWAPLRDREGKEKGVCCPRERRDQAPSPVLLSLTHRALTPSLPLPQKGPTSGQATCCPIRATDFHRCLPALVSGHPQLLCQASLPPDSTLGPTHPALSHSSQFPHRPPARSPDFLAPGLETPGTATNMSPALPLPQAPALGSSAASSLLVSLVLEASQVPPHSWTLMVQASVFSRSTLTARP